MLVKYINLITPHSKLFRIIFILIQRSVDSFLEVGLALVADFSRHSCVQNLINIYRIIRSKDGVGFLNPCIPIKYVSKYLNANVGFFILYFIH